MVVSQLRASVIMRESPWMASIPSSFVSRRRASASWFTIPFTQPTVGMIQISLRIPTSPFFTTISFECKIFLRNIQWNLNRIVRIVQQSGKVGFYFFLANPASLRYMFNGMSDRSNRILSILSPSLKSCSVTLCPAGISVFKVISCPSIWIVSPAFRGVIATANVVCRVNF